MQPDPMRSADVTGASCLLPQRDARFFSGVLPLFSRCFNRTCLELAHEPLGTAPHTASGHASNGEFGMLRGGLTSTPITEFRCGASEIDELHAVERVHAALRASSPVVLRGCTARMPAIMRWASDAYVREVSASTFAPMFGQPFESAATGLDGLDIRLWRDVWWPRSPFAELLWDFSASEGAKTVWVSGGGPKAALHVSTQRLEPLTHRPGRC